MNPPYKVKLGDCFRLGSVGVVVSEMRIKDGEEQRLDSKTLQYLKDEALTLEGRICMFSYFSFVCVFASLRLVPR